MSGLSISIKSDSNIHRNYSQNWLLQTVVLKNWFLRISGFKCCALSPILPLKWGQLFTDITDKTSIKNTTCLFGENPIFEGLNVAPVMAIAVWDARLSALTAGCSSAIWWGFVVVCHSLNAGSAHGGHNDRFTVNWLWQSGLWQFQYTHCSQSDPGWVVDWSQLASQ